MTLIFPDAENNSPRTHALVIGVGGYRHLVGGAEERPQTLEHVGLLQQLTSPPRSAERFAQWLIKTADSWRAPLGSVDLLISPAPENLDPRPARILTEPATIANIQSAYNAWKQRCDRHADNIAVFFFCGHGVEKTEQYLLAEDFGSNPNNPWLGSFAFDTTRLAFHQTRAQTQCFFVDACRKITSGMLTREPTAIPLETPDITAPECAFDLTIQASARNEAALGPKRGVSYFTQALMRALGGGVAVQGSGGWVIETGQVSAQITRILHMVKASQGFKQRCPSRVNASTEILRVRAPRVELVLECAPNEANPVAQLTCSRLDVAGLPELSNQGAPWKIEVDAGIYVTRARFVAGVFRDAEGWVMAFPPSTRPTPLECWP